MIAVLLLALAADTPLSAILIDGEGWKREEGTPPHSGTVHAAKTEKGPPRLVVLVDHGEMWGQPHSGDGAKGETYGAAVWCKDRELFVIAVPSHHHLNAYAVRGGRGLVARSPMYVLRPEKPKGPSNVGSLAFDDKGRMFAAMPQGVQFFDEEARFSGQLSRPEREPVTHVWFGGEKRDELFIRCGEKTWKRKVNTTGGKYPHEK